MWRNLQIFLVEKELLPSDPAKLSVGVALVWDEGRSLWCQCLSLPVVRSSSGSPWISVCWDKGCIFTWSELRR